MAMQRLLVLVCLVAVLAACGFRPRASLALATDLGPVKVQSADPYSPLAQGLSTSLSRAGAQAAVDGQPSATLKVVSESLATRPLALDDRAQVREYETRYAVKFELLDAAGAVQVPVQEVVLTREYTYDSVASAGSPAEQELLQRELRRDMQAAILRRIDIGVAQEVTRLMELQAGPARAPARQRAAAPGLPRRRWRTACWCRRPRMRSARGRARRVINEREVLRRRRQLRLERPDPWAWPR